MFKNEYLVGKGQNLNGSPIFIGYRPKDGGLPDHPEMVAAQVGHGPANIGLAVSASSMLAFKNCQPRWVEEDGKRKFRGTIEEENWFVHRCKEANCEWFVPMVKRMAGGESVPLEEIQAVYLAHNGKPMPCGEWSKLFR